MSGASGAFVRLHHGTTRYRAERLLVTPPDPDYREPGGSPDVREDGFSFAPAGVEGLDLGTPDQYARGKARNFPAEGGPAILEVEVPAAIADLLRNHPDLGEVVATGEYRFVPARRGQPGVGLDELRAAWPTLTKRVILL